MTFRKSIFLLITLGLTAALVACGDGYTPPPMTVALSTVPKSLHVNGTLSITATVANEAANGGVTWSCAPGNSAATCGSFSSPASASGRAVTYTAPATVPRRTVVITATSITNTAIGASTPAIKINATPPITVALSTVPTPVPTSLVANGTLSITATVANDSANGGVTWSCTPGNSAVTCGSFSSPASASGTAVTYTAPATAVSEVTITATSATNTAAFASLPTIAITPAPPPIRVTLSTTPTSLYVNDTLSISATVANDSANEGVTWSCTPGNSAATCGSFSSPASASGTAVTYTAPATVPTRTVVITATSVTNTAAFASTPAITINATVISVALTTAPPSSLFEGGNATIAATVTGDPAGRGVNWTCTPASTCGAFNPTSTASAASTVYTAGSTTGHVVITATSVSDDARSASANVTIARGLAAGTYVFSLSGTTSDGFIPYRLSGAFTIAGGVITGGEQDFVYYYGNLNDLINPTGSSISPTVDGNLQITLQTCNGTGANACNSRDTNIGLSDDGTEVLGGSVLPLSTTGRTFITEFDGWATSSGELDMQDSTAATVTPSLGYAFAVNGLDSNGYPISIGGIIDVDNLTGSGTISGTHSIFDANDGASGTTYQKETFAASTVSAPGNFGRVLLTLNPTDKFDFPTIVLAGYIVDSNRIRLVETFDAYEGSLGGTAFSQGANTSKFTSASVTGNSYVVSLNGYDGNGVFQVAGQITFGDTAVTGFVDFNDLHLVEPASPDSVTAPAYTVDTTGRVTITGLADTSDVADFNLQLYLDGNGHALAITLDGTDVLGGAGAQQSGVGSFTAGSFSGAYGVSVTGADAAYEYELDAAGPLVADGVGAFSGFVDLNLLTATPEEVPDGPVSGTFTSNANGIFTGTVTGVDVTNCILFNSSGTVCTNDVFSYYLIDAAGDNIAIETDTNQLTLGFFAQQ